MTSISPVSGLNTPAATTPASDPTNQFGEDTFLKLLVAQMKYQDPLSPVDSTQFMTQTAQFTQLETLQKIEKEQSALTSSNQVLTASSLVGRSVTYSLSATPGAKQTPTPTTVVSVRGTLPKDATTGAHATAHVDVYTASGTKVPVTLDFARGADGWTLQVSSNGHDLGNSFPLQFDASGDHSNGDVSIPASALNGLAGTTGEWPPTGITLGFGGTNDPTRLQLASGPATVAIAEQNGNDGQYATGIVTGFHITADGPQLHIGTQDIPLSSVSDVQE